MGQQIGLIDGFLVRLIDVAKNPLPAPHITASRVYKKFELSLLQYLFKIDLLVAVLQCNGNRWSGIIIDSLEQVDE